MAVFSLVVDLIGRFETYRSSPAHARNFHR